MIDMDLGQPNAGRVLYDRVEKLGVQVDALVNAGWAATASSFKDSQTPSCK